jgi:hypothetical protein
LLIILNEGKSSGKLYFQEKKQHSCHKANDVHISSMFKKSMMSRLFPFEIVQKKIESDVDRQIKNIGRKIRVRDEYIP